MTICQLIQYGTAQMGYLEQRGDFRDVTLTHTHKTCTLCAQASVTMLEQGTLMH